MVHFRLSLNHFVISVNQLWQLVDLLITDAGCVIRALISLSDEPEVSLLSPGKKKKIGDCRPMGFDDVGKSKV